MAKRVTPRRCIICGGLIVARGVPVWTQFIDQGDAPFPVKWEEAHMACSLVLSDEDEAITQAEGGGSDG